MESPSCVSVPVTSDIVAARQYRSRLELWFITGRRRFSSTCLVYIGSPGFYVKNRNLHQILYYVFLDKLQRVDQRRNIVILKFSF